MRKGGVIVAKEAEDVDVVVVKEGDLEEVMAIALIIMKIELKIRKPRETVEEEVSQGHTEEGIIKIMLNVIIVKDLSIMLLNVEVPRIMLRRKPTMLKI
jgi:hypothetical protein